MRARAQARSMSVDKYCPCAPQVRRVTAWRAAGRMWGGHVQAGGHPAAGALVHLGLEVRVCVYVYVCVCVYACLCRRARAQARCMSVAEYCPCAPQARRVPVRLPAGGLRAGHVQAGGHPAAGVRVHLGLEVRTS